MPDEILRMETGSLYPALHRMTEAGLLRAGWRISEAGRRARFYELTAKGRRKLEAGEKRGSRSRQLLRRSFGRPERRHGTLFETEEDLRPGP